MPDQAAPHRGPCGCRPRSRRLGLGDLVAAGLKAVGITPARISRLLGKPCGCKRRREQWNRWGSRLGIG